MTLNRTRTFRVALGLALAIGAVTAGHLVTAQVTRVDGYEATLANVQGLEGTPVRIDLVRWSTDDDREDLVEALVDYADGLVAHEEWVEARAAEAAAAEAAAAEAAANPPAEEAEAGRGGRGGRAGAAGRGGRGGRGGGDDAEPETPPEPDPLGDLNDAFAAMDTAGVLWADSASGYTIKFAYNEAMPDGGERVLLLTSTPLGEHRFRGWPTVEGPEQYPYSLIEFRIPSNGTGVGKSSLSTRIVVDADANTVSLEDWDAAPVLFDDVALAPGS